MTTIDTNNKINSTNFAVLSDTIPTQKSCDRLHFKSGRAVRYLDHGLWENRVKKITNTVLSTTQGCDSATAAPQHRSLDDLCADELSRRHPTGFTVRGAKGFIENAIQRLYSALKLNKNFSYFSQAALNKYKKQIAHSTTNRADLHSAIKIHHPELRENLKIDDDNKLATTHVLLKNSPMNGQSYLDEKGVVKHVTEAICSSGDRKAENTANLRRIAAAHSDSSICYTGRVETATKALEQASFIFLSELKSSRSGITEPVQGDEEVIYTLDYAVSSAITSNIVMGKKIPMLCPIAERDLICKEREALDELARKSFVEITDPDTQRVYKVKLNPIMMSDSLNAFQKFEHTLSDDLSGAELNDEICKEGMIKLEALIDRKIDSLDNLYQTLDSPEGKAKIEEEINTLRNALAQYQRCDHKNFPEHRLFARDYLYKLLNIPVAYHCKSSTDRTGILIAISSALRQWLDLGNEMPEEITDLLSNKYFKELFAANLMTGHQITRYARSFEGSINEKKGCEHKLGYTFGKGIFQNPIVQRMMPERYLRELTTQEKVLAYLQAGSVQIGSLFMVVVKTLYNIGIAFKRLIMERRITTIEELFKPCIHFRPTQLHRLIPEKVLNEHSPQISDRHLLSSTSARCPDIVSSCFEKTKECSECDARIKEGLKNAESDEEIKRYISEYKQNHLTGSYDIQGIPSDFIVDRFRAIDDAMQQSPDFSANEALEEIKGLVLDTIKRDLERIIPDKSPRRIVINGKEYGSLLSDDQQENARLALDQAQEIYDIIKEFLLKTRPELASDENRIELEKTILLAIDDLHQGAFTPLMDALFQEFNGNKTMVAGKNDFIGIELTLDPFEVHEDGRIGEMLLKRTLIMEIVDMNILTQRAAIGTLVEQPPLSFIQRLDPSRDDSNEYTLDKWKMKEYKNKDLQGLARVVAYSEQDISLPRPVHIDVTIDKVL